MVELKKEINQSKGIALVLPQPSQRLNNARPVLRSQQSQTDYNSSCDSPVFISIKNEDETKRQNKWKTIRRNVKISIFVFIWGICFFSLLINNVQVQQMHQISIPKGQIKSYLIWDEPVENKMFVMLEGALVPPYYSNLSTSWMQIWIQLLVLKDRPKYPNKARKIKPEKILMKQNVSEVWYVPLVSEKLIDVVPEVKYKQIFHLNAITVENSTQCLLEMQFSTNVKTNFPVSMGYNLKPINTDYGIIYAALVLVGLYFVIIFELMHRTLAAMLASTISLAILAVMNARPTMSEIISWIDVETLLLLFSMMTLVSILGETGIFDYMSVLAYKKTEGKIWPLVNTLCVITALFSSFLDNVTTTLLITPVTIKLCEVTKLNPVPVLTYMLIFANIGGAITPIGDPPNVIIASNAKVLAAGVNFGTFTLHMSIGAVIVFAVTYAQMRYTHRDATVFKYTEKPGVSELRHEIGVWQRCAASLGSYSKDEEVVKETLLKRTNTLMGILNEVTSANNTQTEIDSYYTNLEDLEKKYPIKNKSLLIKSGLTLFLVICVFFLHSVPELSRLGLGWTALLGAVLLLLLHDGEDIESIFNRVEWSTLLFFASLFILMEALARLGLIEWVGIQTKNVIMSVGQESRLAVAVILILWVSAVASAFVDNLPLTTMMVRIATNLADNRELELPLQPLVWALSFGACLGGNGTLFGSSSNIVCAGVAEQHGYKFSFLQFTKFGLPVMITSMAAITAYLIVCHVVFSWH